MSAWENTLFGRHERGKKKVSGGSVDPVQFQAKMKKQKLKGKREKFKQDQAKQFM